MGDRVAQHPAVRLHRPARKLGATIFQPFAGGARPPSAKDLKDVGPILDLAGATGVWSNLPLSAELTPGIEGNGSQAASVSYRLTLPVEILMPSFPAMPMMS